MNEPFMPNTDHIRVYYKEGTPGQQAQFNLWLAEHDKEVREQALKEVREWANQLDSMPVTGGASGDVTSPPWIRFNLWRFMAFQDRLDYILDSDSRT